MRTTEENMKLFIRIKKVYPRMVLFVTQSTDNSILIYEQEVDTTYTYSKLEYETLSKTDEDMSMVTKYFELVKCHNDQYTFSCIDNVVFQIKPNRKCYLTETEVLVNVHVDIKSLQAKVEATLSILDLKTGKGHLQPNLKVNMDSDVIWDLLKKATIST